MADAKPMNDGQIHELAAEQVLTWLRSRSSGLTTQEVAARSLEFGQNRLDSPSSLRWMKSLFKHFVNFFTILLDNALLTGESRSQTLKSVASKGRLMESPNTAVACCGAVVRPLFSAPSTGNSMRWLGWESY